jgi:replicative superfamily II helicase
MLLKAAFLGFLIIFIIFSSIFDLPPGTIVTQTMNLSFPYSFLLTNNLINGIFFATIIASATYVYKRKTKQITRYTHPTSTLDPEIEKLLSDDIITETVSNLTEIKGIGPKRAIELEIAGVRTIADLAKRSPQHLAEKTGISITQISKWIIEANKLKNN